MQTHLEELTKVVLSKEDLSMDKHAEDKIIESAALFSKSPPYHPASATSDTSVTLTEEQIESMKLFPKEFCRAAVYGCAVSLLQGRAGVQLPVIKLLLDMLEYEVIPCFSSVQKIGSELIRFMSGDIVPCYYYGMKISSDAALLSSGLEKVELNMHDYTTLERGHFFFTGIAGLLAAAGTSVFRMVDVIAAMSVEATGTAIDAFDVSQYENYRPHRGMINSATLIHQLLDGSQRTGTYDGPISPSFLSVPAVHGPSHEYMVSAAKYVNKNHMISFM